MLVITMSFSLLNGGFAQEQSRAHPEFTAGVYVSPPFVTKDGEHYTGMAVELWESAAKSLGQKFTYREYPTFEALTAAIESGEAQAGVTNLTITKDRALLVSFSQPWYDAGLRILVAEKSAGGFWQVLGGLEAAGHLRAMSWMIVFILFATVLLAVFYRRFDQSFPRKWHVGLAESFYEVMSVATSGKITRPNILGWVGRISGGLWMVCGVAVIAYMTSSVTSVMTALSLTHQINSVADLPGKSVGVLNGSVAERYGQELRLDVKSFAQTHDAVNALNEGEIAAIIGDAPVLEYYVHSNPGSPISVVGSFFHPDKYGFAFQHGNPIAQEGTLQIRARQETGELGILRRRYFGNE